MSLPNFPDSRKVFIIAVIFICITGLLMAANENFKIVEQSSQQIQVKFNLSGWSVASDTKDGIEYKTIKTTQDQYLYIDETPTLPVYSTMVAVPEGMDVNVSYNNNDTETISNFIMSSGSLMDREQNENNLFPARILNVSEPAQLRDFRVVSVNLYPFQLNTSTHQLSVVKSGTITLRFVPSSDGYRNDGAGYYSTYYDNLYSSMILNYQNVRDEATPITKPVLLIIYPSAADATFITKLDQFVTWKKQKGYTVNIASTATAQAGNSTTTIKAYILAQYNTLSTRPDVVILMGDASGTLIVPSYSEYMSGWTGYNSEGDYPYSLLAGGDQYGDVQLGRMSVETTEQLNILVAKTLSYEKNVTIASAAWLDKMLLVGDTSSSGISTVYTNRYIHDVSFRANPDYTYTELYGALSSPASAINAAISQGVGFYNYRGWLGMSGWGPGSTNNSNKLNHGVMITCGTGTFISGTSTTESYIRQGTEASPTGGVTAIGMATTGTHTAFNNMLDCGIFDGIYNRGMRSMGESLLYSKWSLISLFGYSNTNTCNFFNRICNLMGDPTVETFISIPNTFLTNVPTSITLGTNNYEFVITDANAVPVANALVNLYQTTNCNVSGYTDAAGKVVLTIPTTISGTLTFTVSKHDFKPTQTTISISTGGIVCQGSVIDDDNTAPSIGNSNGVINSGETIEYKAVLKNTTSSTISTVTATLTVNDQYVTVSTSRLNFGNIAANATAMNGTAARFIVSPACPDNHPFTINLSGSSSIGAWNVAIPMVIRAADLDYLSYTITSGSNSVLDPGETAGFTITIKNNGTESVSNVTATLTSSMYALSVVDGSASFGTIASGATVTNTADQFSLFARSVCLPGMTVPMTLTLSNPSGYTDTESYTLTIGQSTLTDPLGQDSYGYFIYDDGDVNYAERPTYSWIGIAPAEGGSGTLLSFTDTSTDGSEGDTDTSDSIELLTLPFTIKFYGIDYTQMTVCSNGFLAMGSTLNADFRNGRLPGVNGPNPMIAPFWDDLIIPGTGGIYKYYDSTNHRLIIEWYGLKNGDNPSYTETFQVIFYDQNYFPTSTMDTAFKIQYQTFNNVDTGSTQTNGNYCSIGIKNQTGNVGLEYSFNNQYPTAAKPITNSTALYVTTAPVIPNSPVISIGTTSVSDPNMNGYIEPGETVSLSVSLNNAGSADANGVNVVLTESDPYITISQSTSAYPVIPGLGSGVNTTGFVITVASNCPADYIFTLQLAITATGGYSWNRSITYQVYRPVVSYSQTIITDVNGNGFAEPGETVNLGIRLNNTGLVAANNLTAVVSESDAYIAITQNTSAYDTISPSGNGLNTSYFVVSVASNCPENYTATIQMAVTGSNGYSNTLSFSLQVHKPTLVLQSWVIEDIAGNSNGTLDTGESSWLVMNLQNQESVPVNNLTLGLSSNNVNITLGTTQIIVASIQGLKTYQAVTQVTVGSSVTNGTVVTFTLNGNSDNASAFATSIVTTVGVSSYSYNFESNNGGFVATNSLTPGWEWGIANTAGAHGGTKVWGCVLNGTYGDNATYELVTPTIQVGTGSNLTFWHRYWFEVTYDGGRVMISNDNGANWTMLTPVGSYPSTVTVFSGPGYGSSVNSLNSWAQATFSLSAYAGQSVKLKWLMQTDGSVVRSGWFLDDVVVSNATGIGSVGIAQGTVALNPADATITNTMIAAGNVFTTPNASGTYKLRLPAGTYVLSSSLPGYSNATANATVTLNSTVSNLNMTLNYMYQPIEMTWMVQENQLNLRWNTTDTRLAFQHYNIYRRLGTDAWSQIAETTATSYSTTLTQNTWYDYKITAQFDSGESNESNQVHIVYPDNNATVAPVTPQSLSVVQNGTLFNLNWEPVSVDINSNPITPWGYNVYAGDTPDFIPSASNLLGMTASNTWSYTAGVGVTRVFFKVTAALGYLD